jgi:hypothetical protein
MKKNKIILLFLFVTLLSLSGYNLHGQCVQQEVTINNQSSMQVCKNYGPSCTLTIYLEYSPTLGNIFRPVTVKRPDGSVDFVITMGNSTYVSPTMRTYIIAGGYFSIVGDYHLDYTTKMSDCVTSINRSLTINVYGFLTNSIGSNEVICSGGGLPSNIVNNGLSSNSAYSIVWQNSVDGSNWNTISGATADTYQPTYINTTTHYKRITTTTLLSCVNTSNTVIKNVYSSFFPGSISGSQNNCYSVTPTQLTQTSAPSGGSGSYSYEWYVSTDGSNFSLISGETGITYQPVFSQGTRYFKRRDYDANCGNSYTNTVNVFGYSSLIAGTITTDQTICYNITPGSLNVGTVASGGSGTYSYQWQVSPDGSVFGDVSGALGTTYQPSALTSSKWYRLKVINSCETSYTNSVKITVYNPLIPGTITTDQTICYNITPVSLNVGTVASGGSGTYTYQWQVSTDGSVFSDISGATGTTYQPPSLTSSRWYRLKVINSCETGYTNSVKITVYNPLSPGTITADQTICFNITPGTLNVSTSASGGSGSYTYQWQVSPDGSSFGDIASATGTSYQPPALTSSRWYRLKVINSCETGYTGSIKITVYNPLSPGTITADQTICYNITPGILNVGTSASGGSGSYSYQWQVSPDGSSFGDIASATGTSYQPPALTSNKWYRLKVINSCETGYTGSIKITVYNPFSPGSITADQTICYNITPDILSVGTIASGGSGTYTYQWQVSTDGSVFGDVTGQTGTTYQPPALTSSKWYRLKIINSCETGYTNSVKITVYNQFNPGTITANQTICYNITPGSLNVGAIATGGSGAYTYQWENSIDGTNWNLIIGATSDNFQPANLVNTTFYRRNVINTCNSGYTNPITITVRPELIAGTITNSQTICYNTTPSLLVTNSLPTGGTGSFTYQWQNSVNNTTWNNITGATAETYSPGAMTSSLYYRRSETCGSCGTVQTNSVHIIVNGLLVAGTVKSDQTICYGTVPGIFITNTYPTGGTGSYSYQWQKLVASLWTDIASANAETYTSGALTSTTYLRRTETSATCGTVISNQITVTVHNQLLAGVIGSSQTVNYGAVPAELVSVQSASGGAGSFSYQWQSSLDNSSWSNITGATSESFQPLALTVKKYFKRLTTDGSCGTIETNVLTINVNSLLDPGTIAANQAICYNTTPVTLTTSTTPSGANGSYLYQWQKTEDGITWTNITAANSDSYQSAALINTTYFRKKVTSVSFEDFTNIVTITVNPAFAPGTIGSDQTVCKTYVSAPITTTILPTGQSIQYLWQVSDNNASWSDITGATNDYYDAGVLSTSKYFRKKVTSSCSTGYTNSVKIIVNDELQGGIIGNDQAITYNTTPSLLTGTLPTGGSGTFTYQWFYSINNVDWQLVIISGYGKDYQPGVLSQKTYFKRKVTGGSCGEKYSNTVTITVFESILPGVVGEAQSICYNTVPALLSGTSPGGGTDQYSYQWQYSLQGVTWIDISSEVGISYKPDALKVNTYYRRAVTSGNSTVYSNFVMIKVYDQVSQPVTDLKGSYCRGSVVNINIANPAYLSYKWYDSQHAYLMDGTKYTLNNITGSNTIYIKSLNTNGCLSDFLEQKILVDNVEASFTPDITTVTLGDAIKFTNTSVNASSYSWNFFEGDIITENSPVHYYNLLGVNPKRFSVLLVAKSPGGCIDSLLQNELITVVNPLTGIEPNNEVTFSYYPNPVMEKLYISSNKIIETIRVFNSAGQMIESRVFDNDLVFVDFSTLKSGIYFLEINGLKKSKKIIKIIKK